MLKLMLALLISNLMLLIYLDKKIDRLNVNQQIILLKAKPCY
jgi:hypothetical protein